MSVKVGDDSCKHKSANCTRVCKMGVGDTRYWGVLVRILWLMFRLGDDWNEDRHRERKRGEGGIKKWERDGLTEKKTRLRGQQIHHHSYVWHDPIPDSYHLCFIQTTFKGRPYLVFAWLSSYRQISLLWIFFQLHYILALTSIKNVSGE